MTLRRGVGVMMKTSHEYTSKLLERIEDNPSHVRLDHSLGFLFPFPLFSNQVQQHRNDDGAANDIGAAATFFHSSRRRHGSFPSISMLAFNMMLTIAPQPPSQTKQRSTAGRRSGQFDGVWGLGRWTNGVVELGHSTLVSIRHMKSDWARGSLSVGNRLQPTDRPTNLERLRLR